MREVDKILENYYEDYDEDARLIKDKAHKVEYITTIKYIDKFLKKGNRILEVGAGTGRYSLHYAEKGYQVDSVELVNKNLEILKSKIKKNMNINAIQGNALDLNMYKDDTFDITLVLGPLYHLYEYNEINQAIEEAIRVTKKNGKIFIAYIPNDAVFLNYGIKSRQIKRLKKLCDENWKIKNIKEEIFSTFKVEEFNKIMDKHKVRKIKNVSTDGVSQILKDYINCLDDEEFNLYVDYHLKNCERYDIMGISAHSLYICEKI